MNRAELMKTMRDLEIANNELRAELTSFDALMRRVGFVSGIETVKATALQLAEETDCE